MKKLLAIPAYLWAIACLLLIPVTFIGNESFAKELARLPFMKVHPIYSGGDQAKIITDAELETTIYKPVFDALVGESKTGFVQVRFSSPSDTLPQFIKRDIDYNFDNAIDFSVDINTVTGETKISPVNCLVNKMNVSSRVKEDWIVRVSVKNPKRQ
jgi:hypothetical protein